MFINKIFMLVMLILAIPAKADIYPKSLPNRIYGFDQVQAMSCQAEAESEAIEQSFANRGQKVSISSFHRHLKNWQDGDLAFARIRVFNAEDKKIMNTTGSIIPDYMFPSGNFRQKSGIGWRPRISEMSIIDTNFPKDDATGFQKKFHAFYTDPEGNDYSNTVRDLNVLKKMIANNTPVTLNLHGTFLDAYLDHNTGILNQKYDHKSFLDFLKKLKENKSILKNSPYASYLMAIEQSKQLLKDNKDNSAQVDLYVEKINHSVAIVGYIDRMYPELPDPSAYIVRNSWNDLYTIKQSLDHSHTSALAKFKVPLFKQISGNTANFQNLVGYYAIPTQYIRDMLTYKNINHPRKVGAGGFHSLEINFDVFYRAYNQYISNYKIYQIPFKCGNTDSLYDHISNDTTMIIEGLSSSDELEKEYARKMLLSQTSIELMNRGSSFNLATITDRTNSKTVINRFISGKFDDYYCADSETFPSTYSQTGLKQSYSTPAMWKEIENISSNPYNMMSWLNYYRTLHKELNL